ncbi:hypothetical protein GCM10023196_017460 [Actinoallomurus vinaceus]|uniref:PH domain-containing protein n=1 Tax=Actinoallomurus vinaceus TaxID=1080074 RepID=A0ABP8U3K0_9ACTN
MSETGFRPAAVEIGYAWPGLREIVALPLIGLLATVCLGLWATNEGSANLIPAVLCVFCGVGTAWLGGSVARAAWRATRGRPLLTLDSEQVVLHSARVALPWSNVAEIRIVNRSPDGQTAKLIVFVPVDADRAVAGLRGMSRRFARSGMKHVGGPIFVRPEDMTSPFGEFLNAVRALTTVPVRPAIDPRTAGRIIGRR